MAEEVQKASLEDEMQTRMKVGIIFLNQLKNVFFTI